MFDKIKSLLGGKGGEIDLGSLPLSGYEKYLKGVTYPIGIDDVMRALKNNGAPSQLISVVEGLATKGTSSFNSQDDLVNAVKGALGGKN